MRLNRLNWLIIIFALLAIAFLGLGMARSQQMREKEQLSQQLSLNASKIENLQLEQLSMKKSQLEGKVSETLKQTEQIKDRFRVSVNSVVITDSIYELAGRYGLEITELGSPGLGEESLEGVNCLTSPLLIRVNGNMPDLIRFLADLRANFKTSVIKNTKADFAEVGKERVSAEVRISIYSYQDQP